MNELTNVRPTLPVSTDFLIPERLGRRPWSQKHKAPIPWFVETVNGEPDFRVVKTARMFDAIDKRLCWICGERLGQHMAFNLGPISAINRMSSEPPGHKECALYSAQACPFLSHPNKDRRTAGLPDEIEPGPGMPILHNPGVTLVWLTKGYKAEIHERTKLLFAIGDPHELYWFAEGRAATRIEVEAAFNKGLPILQELAAQDGPAAMAELAARLDQARTLLPR